MPKRLFVLATRIVVLVDHNLSFTLNLRLLFTPFFGDYTKMGRLIGFSIRIIQIVFGFVFEFVVFILSFLLPLIWVLIPAYLVVEMRLLLLLLYSAAVALLMLLTRGDRPKVRVSEVKKDSPLSAFRPEAAVLAKKIVSKNVLPKDFFKAPKVSYLLKKLELTMPDFEDKLIKTKQDYSGLFSQAVTYAKEHKTRFVEVEHLFISILALNDNSKVFLSKFGTTLAACVSGVYWIVSEREELAKKHFWQEDYSLPKMGGIGRGMTGRVTPFLDRVSQDLTRMAQNGEIKNIFVHQKEIQDVTKMISGTRANVLLVGPPGCGKTSVVKGIAQRIVEGTEFKEIRFKRLVSLDTAALVAGTKSAGQVSENLNKALDEAKASGDVIIFFDEIHNLITGATGSDESSIFSLLEPVLSNAEIQFIGATNLENYRKHLEPNGSFTRLFQTVELGEASEEDTLSVLKGVSRDREKEFNLLITFPSLLEIIRLSKKLIHDRVFPDKAIQILNRICNNVSGKDKTITVEDVRREISDVTHVPVNVVDEEESKKVLNIGNELKKRVVGQDHALTQIERALQRARAGVRDETKPIASFLFVGTTGVGKTETAKALASSYFGDEDAMVRLDMSEYQQQDSINRLLGTPDGSSKGVLTEAVRSKPFTLVLLDEIEKADSNVLLTFLQVLDDGRLTDPSGRVIDFTNTIIIATSNVGTREIQDVSGMGSSFEEINEVAQSKVREHFAPEFLNRFTGIVVYRPLSITSVRKIADIKLNKIRKIAEEKSFEVSFTDELLDELISRGYKPEWGARELNRVVEDFVETYVARALLSKEISMGDKVELGIEVFEE